MSPASAYMQFMTSRVLFQRHGRIRWPLKFPVMKTTVKVDEDYWGFCMSLEIILWIKLVKLARYMRFMDDETTNDCDK